MEFGFGRKEGIRKKKVVDERKKWLDDEGEWDNS